MKHIHVCLDTYIYIQKDLLFNKDNDEKLEKKTSYFIQINIA